jgi:hypothetical protein
MVWQDFMFANFDYGSETSASPALDDARREVSQWLTSTRAHPSLAVLCGGSEAEQQASMMGASRGVWRQPLFDSLIPALVAEHRPGDLCAQLAQRGRGRSSPIPACRITTAWARTSGHCPMRLAYVRMPGLCQRALRPR